MLKVLLIGFGGALGSILRYFISTLMVKYICSSFPCGILTVNLIGSFLITFLMEFFITSAIDPLYRYIFIIGFLGGFTTLSSVIYDTFILLQNGKLILALLNLLLNSLLTLTFGLLGHISARIILFKGL